MIATTPYARLLGIREIADEAGDVYLMMPVSEKLEGREGFLYGGVIASLLELACLDAIGFDLGGSGRHPKPINMTFDFLRGGQMLDTFARARIIREGRRVINADAVCWQADAKKPIATGRMHILLG